MLVSVVIRTKDEADRLRLTLASPERQAEPPDVIVVDDGSSDHTKAVIAKASGSLRLQALHHPSPQERSAASNAGARLARGDIVLFPDGDTLAGPDFVARHLAVHRTGEPLIGRGETFHLRSTRFFLDPETATPRCVGTLPDGSAVPPAADHVG